MTTGINIFNASSTLTYSSDDVTWNQVDVLYCPADVTTSGTYPVIDGKEVLTVQVMINPPPIDERAVAHTITVSGTTVTVTGGTVDTYVVVLMR